MNEKRIREVIEVEQRALERVSQATREAEQVPVQAQAEAEKLIQTARVEAQDEARRLVERAQTADEAASIISRAEAEMTRIAAMADKNFERAVAHVVDRVLGKG